MVEQLQRQMIAHIVEVILVKDIGDFVQLNAGLLRVDFGLPADVDDDYAFVCGVDDKSDGQGNAAGGSKQNRYRLKSESSSINQTNETERALAFPLGVVYKL